VSFTIAAGFRQRSHSQVRVPRDSWSYFTVSDSRSLQHVAPGPCIYIPQEQGGLVIFPGTSSIFIASYDSQGYGGVIRTRLCTEAEAGAGAEAYCRQPAGTLTPGIRPH
jgi:hypothetical protein